MQRILLCLLLAPALLVAEQPPLTNPRQTSGDNTVTPKWEEQLTVTVGPKDADIIGHDQRAIQAAVDYVARLGGGTVHIQAGFWLSDPLRHPSPHSRRHDPELSHVGI